MTKLVKSSEPFDFLNIEKREFLRAIPYAREAGRGAKAL
jgi:hypothetical protein